MAGFSSGAELITAAENKLEPVIMRNEARNLSNELVDSMNNQTDQLNQPMDANGRPIESPAPMVPKL